MARPDLPRPRRRKLRAAVLARDLGVCGCDQQCGGCAPADARAATARPGTCGRDTVALAAQVGELRARGYLVRRDVLRAARWEADHVRPLWRGGADTLDNLATCCGLCHDAKTSHDAGRRARERRGPSWKSQHGLCDGSNRRPALRRVLGGAREHVCGGCGRPATRYEVGHRRIGPHRPADAAAAA